MQWDKAYLESEFNKYINNINEWVPEGITDVNLELLHRLDLLHYHSTDKNHRHLTRYFQVSQTDEKITLINDQFVVWIVPDKVDNMPITYTFIALKTPSQLQLEVVFATWGIYNSSRLVLRVLEKMLCDIQETEKVLHNLLKEAT